MKTNPKRRKLITRNRIVLPNANNLLLNIGIILTAFLSIILTVGPVYANPRGITAEVYLTKDSEIISVRPNSLTVVNGQIAIILAGGVKVMILENKD